MTDTLRRDLSELADEVRLVDLHDRAVRTSRRGVRRTRLATGGALLLVVALAGIALRPVPDPTSPVDASVSLANLREETLDVPTTWVPGGPALTFDHGRHELPADGPLNRALTIIDAATGDVYREGRRVTAVLVGLEINSRPLAFEVLVVERSADGRVATRGVVTGLRDGLQGIGAVRVPAAGKVDIDVRFPLGDLSTSPAVQGRGFSWDGHGFVQTSGPASFADHPLATRVSVTTPGAKLLAQPDGGYRGTLVVTIRNDGQQPIAVLTLTVIADRRLRLDSPDATAGPDDGLGPESSRWTLTIRDLDPGAEAIRTLDFNAASRVPSNIDCSLLARATRADGTHLVDLGGASIVACRVR